MDKSVLQRANAIIRAGGLRTTIACLAFLPLSIPAFAHTERSPERALDLQQHHAFNIPSESLNAALTAFSAETGIHVVTSRVPSGVFSPGASGDVSTVSALRALLQGTGMSFRQIDAETIVVVPADTAAKLRPAQFLQLGDMDQNALADQPPTTAGAPAVGAPGAPPTTLQEVTVSASAISIAGYEAPTPVTAIGIQQLQSAAQPEIGDVLRQMPQITGETAENGSTSGDVSDNLGGVNTVDLRNIGVNRTLVLFDSQRVVQVSNQGGVDSTLIPSTLVERVDVVTGGASATYGSDAIAGVVNIIINKNFNGALINVMASNNTQSTDQQQRADITLGMPFADNRGHVEVAGSVWNSPQWSNEDTIPGWNSQGWVANPKCTGYSAAVVTNGTCPPGQYLYMPVTGVEAAKATQGGIITSGLNGQPIPLDFTAFGPNGTPYLFNCGTESVNTTCWGGTNDAHPAEPLSAPLKNYTAFGLISFIINDNLKASLQLNYARTSVQTQLNNTRQLGNIPIYSGNPYIPAAIQSQLTALNLPGFEMGNTLDDPAANSLGTELDTLGDDVFWNYRTLQRGVLTLDGQLGPKWTWNAYYQHGQNQLFETAWSNVDVPNLAEAEDAVAVTPAINAAVPSLPVGSITCAANVPAALLPGGATGLVATGAIHTGAQGYCQPVNLMGLGMFSQAAKNYILGPAQNNLDTDNNTIMESVWSASVQGELPFGLAAPIAAEAGILYRGEGIAGINCGINCTDVYFHGGNFVNDKGYYDIKEGNAEINIPVLKNQWVESLSFDAAARWSDYSTSGSVETYKFGVVSQLNNWLRFRGSYSVDIRAPNLYELFEAPQSQANTVLDPRTGISGPAFLLNEGNPNLIPETAETRTFGFVFTPVQGMNVSIDWYYIAISDIIDEGLASNVVESGCIAGVSADCEALIFGHYPTNYCTGPTLNSCPLSEPLSDTVALKANANGMTNSGMDFNGDYRMPFMDGTIDFNAVMNYTFESRLTVLGRTNDDLNSLGGAEGTYDTSIGPETGTTTKFHGTVAVTYTQGGWLGTAQARMIGAAWQTSQWINTNFISNANNAIPFITYLDLRLSYEWANGLQLYGALDDALDKYPPWNYGIDTNTAGGGVRGDIYDQFGRAWRLGLRYRFGG